MVIENILLAASTLIITIGVLIATLYRIKIEKKTIEIQYANALALKTIRALKTILNNERDEILNMTGKEFVEFLEEVCKDEN